MNPCQLHISEIRYTPECSGFAARATLHDAGIAYVYPVHVAAPLTADFDRIISLLVKKAHQMHARRQRHIHMHRAIWQQAMTGDHPRAA